MNWHLLNQTAHLYFIIWSKIFLILCSKLNANEALSGEVGSGSKDTVQRKVTWPAGCPSQVIGNFRLASRVDWKAEVFLLFLYPFMSDKAEGSFGGSRPSGSGVSLLILLCICGLLLWPLSLYDLDTGCSGEIATSPSPPQRSGHPMIRLCGKWYVCRSKTSLTAEIFTSTGVAMTTTSH